tara:strand:- start:997 stop:1206 length:210 start_codon:yes stop_codon:yes gene_type:complete
MYLIRYIAVKPKFGRAMTDKITSSNATIGSDFADFLRDEDMYEDVQSAAIKRVVAWQIAEEMKRQSKSR